MLEFTIFGKDDPSKVNQRKLTITRDQIGSEELVNLLSNHVNSLECVQTTIRTTNITFTTSEEKERILQSNLSWNGKKITMHDVAPRLYTITILGLPDEYPDDVVTNIFSTFGKIEKYYRVTKKCGNMEYRNGNRVVHFSSLYQTLPRNISVDSWTVKIKSSRTSSSDPKTAQPQTRSRGTVDKGAGVPCERSPVRTPEMEVEIQIQDPSSSQTSPTLREPTPSTSPEPESEPLNPERHNAEQGSLLLQQIHEFPFLQWYHLNNDSQHKMMDLGPVSWLLASDSVRKWKILAMSIIRDQRSEDQMREIQNYPQNPAFVRQDLPWMDKSGIERTIEYLQQQFELMKSLGCIINPDVMNFYNKNKHLFRLE